MGQKRFVLLLGTIYFYLNTDVGRNKVIIHYYLGSF